MQDLYLMYKQSWLLLGLSTKHVHCKKWLFCVLWNTKWCLKKDSGASQTLPDTLTYSRLEVLSRLAYSKMFLMPHHCSLIKFHGSTGSTINRTAMVCTFAHQTASTFIPEDLHTTTQKGVSMSNGGLHFSTAEDECAWHKHWRKSFFTPPTLS